MALAQSAAVVNAISVPVALPVEAQSQRMPLQKHLLKPHLTLQQKRPLRHVNNAPRSGIRAHPVKIGLLISQGDTTMTTMARHQRA